MWIKWWQGPLQSSLNLSFQRSFSSFYSIQMGLLKLSHLSGCVHTVPPFRNTGSSLFCPVALQDQLWFCLFHEALLDNLSLKNLPSFEFLALAHSTNIYWMTSWNVWWMTLHEVLSTCYGIKDLKHMGVRLFLRRRIKFFSLLLWVESHKTI